MGNMIGADVEALQRLAAQFDHSAERLRIQAGQVANGISVSAWVGPVAVRFRTDWDSMHSVALKATAEALSASAVVLRQNAAAQESASASLATTAHVIGGTPIRSGHGGVWLDVVDGVWRGGGGLLADALTWGDDALRVAFDGVAGGSNVLRNIPTLTKWFHAGGKVLPWVGLATNGYDLLSAVKNGESPFAIADAAVGTYLAGVTMIATAVFPPAGVAVGLVSLGWGALKLASGDTPLTERIFDTAGAVGGAIQDFGADVAQTASDVASGVGEVVGNTVEAASEGARSLLDSAGKTADAAFEGARRFFGFG